MMELAGLAPSSELGVLEWAFAGRKQPTELRGLAGRETAQKIAEFALANDFSAILAPTHYISKCDDPWVSADCSIVQVLRHNLDGIGKSETPIYYSLALPAAALREPLQRKSLIAALKSLPIDALWLRVHPFGTTASGPTALRGYLEACQEFHELGLPLVAEKTGTIGIALLAFGAVGGIELGAFLERDSAREFFEIRRMKTYFVCRKDCCARGLQDMLGDPRKHFVATRAREIARVSSVPVPLRRQIYMEEFLRPATDLALQASQVFPSLEKDRRRLESWRGTLGAVVRENPLKSWSRTPNGRRSRFRNSA